MARRLRFIPRDGALVEVTCRTIQGRLLLKPSKESRSTILGVLGRAQRLYGVRLHAFVFLSNHYHLLVSVHDAQQLSRFMNYLNSNLAREMGRLHRWRERFWGRRYQAIVVSEEEAAQVARLRYILSHGCKEGLVARPRDWPGAHSVKALVEDQALRGIWRHRTREYAARQSGNPRDATKYSCPETVHLEPLPCWLDLSPGRYRERVDELVTEIEVETRERHHRGGTRPLGVRAIRDQNPHDYPRELKKSCAPAFHAATKVVRRELAKAYAVFVSAYREAALRLRDERLEKRFPEGSFPPRLPFARWLTEPALE